MTVEQKTENGIDYQRCRRGLMQDVQNQEASYNGRKCASAEVSSDNTFMGLSGETWLEDSTNSERKIVDARSIHKTKGAIGDMQSEQNQSRGVSGSDESDAEGESEEQLFCSAETKRIDFKLDCPQSRIGCKNNGQNNKYNNQEYDYSVVTSGRDESSEISSDDSDVSTVAIDIAELATDKGISKKNSGIEFVRKRINPGLLSQATFVYGPALAYAAYTAYIYSLPEYNDKGEDGEVLPAYTISRAAAAFAEGALVAGVIPLLEVCADKLRNLKICNSYIFRHLYSRKIELHKVAGISLTAAGVVHTAGHLARAGSPVLTTQEGITGLLMLLGNGVIAGSYLSLKSDCFKRRLTYLTSMKAHRYGAFAMVGLLAAHNSDRRLLPFVGCLMGSVFADRLITHVNHHFVTPIYSIQLLGSRKKQMFIQAELPGRMAAPVPGQYFKLKLPELDVVSGFRNFTGGGIIDGKIHFVISKSGIGTTKMFNAVIEDFNKEGKEQVGDLTKLELIGPYSSVLETIHYEKRVIMVTSGAGCNLVTAKLLYHYKSSIAITMMAIHCCTEPEESLSIIRTLNVAQKYIGGSIHLFFSGDRVSDEDYTNGLQNIKDLLGQIENVRVYEYNIDDPLVESDELSLKRPERKGFTLARQTKVDNKEGGEGNVDQPSLRKIRVHIYNKVRVSTESLPESLIKESKQYVEKNGRGCMPAIYGCGSEFSSNIATSLNSTVAQSGCKILTEFL
ncbi:ferredoxin reductase family protein [Endozoicomonas sp.]|uniref:ferredoxin reductase family protein n=1 Tax=Endozoicomonas sp. TaxID=1892382 RepID=UPI002883BC35|nr:ferredoxin reductase family protein [Endozoicomonas sp.]